MQFALRIERLFGSAVSYNLEPLKQPAAAYAADKWMIAEPLLQTPREMLALLADIGEQAVAPNDPLHRKRGGAGERMTGISVAMLESAGTVGNGLEDPVLQQYRADRPIAAAQSLCNRENIRADAFLLAGMQGAGSAHAAHHFVEDEQNSMAVADLAHALKIAWYRRDGTHRGA